MSFEPGASLRNYRLVEKIGEGGMGVVWKALDTSLGREVAIKVLPPDLADHEERLARFEREARTLAQLRHPNVAGIYGFEQVEDRRLLVMELAEGQDLAARLKAGPLGSIKALEIARQIALGLEEAHAKGIIHRDLKPANVMIDPQGQVKILDFGLARVFDESPPEGDLAHSPTMTAAMTQAGVILGTAAYMSPEQARGQTVDPRTDVWALGAVLFEMITGRQAFSGEVVSDILARILEREPAWEQLPADCHPSVRGLLQRCLAKDPRQRLHAVADARIEIERLLADPEGTAAELQASQAPVSTVPTWRRLLPWALCAALAVWVVVSMLPGPAPVDPLVQFEVLAPLGHEFGEFCVSPDGSTLVFVANNREGERLLWTRTLDSLDLRPLEGTDDATFPFWSPDSRSIGFFAEGKLRRVDLARGSVQTVADAPNGRGADWSDDGTILFTPDGEEVLYAIPASGGEPSPITSLADEEVTHRFPHFLPGSRRFVFSAHGHNSVVTRRYLGSLDSDALTRLPDGMSEAYAPPGWLLLVREWTLYAQGFDASSGSLQGEPFPLAGGVNDIFPRTARAAFSVSDNGVLAYLPRVTVDSHFEWLDRNGRSLGRLAPRGQYDRPVLAHRGDRLVFLRTDSTGTTTSVWVLDLGRETSRQLLEQPVRAGIPGAAWSHDDSSLVLPMNRGILRQQLAGGEPEVLLDVAGEEGADRPLSMRMVQESADGSFLVFSAWDPVSDFDLWLLHLDGDSPARPMVRDPGVQSRPQIAPDMRWIAYESDETGRWEVFVRSAEMGQAKWLISTDGGSNPLWSKSGDVLYYVSADHELMAVSIDEQGGQLQPGMPKALFATPLSAPSALEVDFFLKPLLLAAVDDRFLFQVPAERVPQRTITVVLNWEELTQR
jgi:Tol biopolymer transport system component